MILTAKIQVQPTRQVEEALWSVSRLSTKLWNACIEQRRDPNARGKVNFFTQKKELPILKKELPEFCAPASQALQEVVKSVDDSMKSFFQLRKNGDKDARPPGFRSSRVFFTQTYNQNKTSFDLSHPGEIRLAYGKSKKDWMIIKLPQEVAFNLVKTVDVKYDHLQKKWYVLLAHEVKCEKKKEDGLSIYFDPGCKTSLTGLRTDGQFFEYDLNPLRKINLETFKFIDELKSKKDKIKNRNCHAFRRLNRRIQDLFRKIKTRTKNYLHTLANKILEDHGDVKLFKVGNWDKRKTLADTGIEFVDRRINRAVQNNNPLGELISILTYKAERLGKEASKCDERGTTRTCSECDHIHKDGIPVTQRIFECTSCGFKFSRDHQSCFNFVKKYEPVVWSRLSELFAEKRPDRSRRVDLDPFTCKSRERTIILSKAS